LRNRQDKTAVRIAEDKGHTACTEAFREHVRAVSAQSTTAGEASELREEPAQVPTSVVSAVYHGDKDALVAWLEGAGQVDALFHKPDGSVRNSTVLMTASGGGHSQLVDLLLERKASVDLQSSRGMTALMWAARFGHATIVGRLLEAGAHMGLRNRSRKTALDLARNQGHNECEAALKERREELDSERYSEEAASEARGEVQDPAKVPQRVIEAVTGANKAAVVAWLNGGGKVDGLWADPDGSRWDETMLMVASGYGHAELVDLLLERKASVDRQDSEGDTALMVAVNDGNPTVVRRLLMAGAHIGLRNRQDDTALRLAEHSGQTACVEAFREHEQAASAQSTTVEEASEAREEPAEATAEVPQRLVKAVSDGNKAPVMAWLDGGGQVAAL
jgi:ankyrin repeat protein